MIGVVHEAGAKSYRVHGKKPYTVVAIHGGPGTPGSLGYLSDALSCKFGVLEPFQSAHTIADQTEELRLTIASECEDLPVKLIGHSWGAWLAFLFAAAHPDIVGKLILIGAGSFEIGEDFGPGRTRTSRLDENEKAELARLIAELKTPAPKSSDVSAFRRFGELMTKADSYRCLGVDDLPVAFQPNIFRSVWREAEEMRSSGQLLKLAVRIDCPVVAIHGDYDPHPAEGVRGPLARSVRDFRFVLLERCGHYPWKERYAKDKFIRIINDELTEEPTNKNRN